MTGKHGVFLDRDGVLNARRFPIATKPSHMRILPGAPEAAARLSQAGFVLALATNQEWVGRGTITREDHDEMMRLVVSALEAAGAKVDAAYAALEAGPDAKPQPGMLLRGARELGLDLARSFMVGDNRKDMVAGKRAGCATVLVDPRLRTRLQRAEAHADHVARDLPAAVEWILSRGRG